MQNFMSADQEVLWVRFPVGAGSTEGRGAAQNCMGFDPQLSKSGSQQGYLRPDVWCPVYGRLHINDPYRSSKRVW